jgi:hypothetical protein
MQTWGAVALILGVSVTLSGVLPIAPIFQVYAATALTALLAVGGDKLIGRWRPSSQGLPRRLQVLLFGWLALALFAGLVIAGEAIQRRLWDPPSESLAGQVSFVVDFVIVGAGFFFYSKAVTWLASRFPAFKDDETMTEPRITPLGGP